MLNNLPHISPQSQGYATKGHATKRRATKDRLVMGLPAPVLRRLAFSLTLCFVWSLVFAPCLNAADVRVAAAVTRAPAQQRLLWRKQSEKIAAMRAHVSTFPYRQYALARTRSQPVGAIVPAPAAALPPLSLLDSSGHLVRLVTANEVSGWRKELALRPAASRAAVVHLWLGEWALASQDPQGADRHLRQVQGLCSRHDALYGTAAYELALAAYHRDAYEEATADFRVLLSPKTALRGYDRRQCALWLRAAGSCAGYHAQHAKIGIPEPLELDPQCGAAALANARRSLGLSYDKPTILRACQVTGEGSSLQDIVEGARKLSLRAYALTADDQGLIALPKPLVAHVERDHFVSVIRADKHGVSYLCSDCGMWPGGRVDLTWKQWHTMNAGVYGAVCVPGSAWDQALSAVLSGKHLVELTSLQPLSVKVASLSVAGMLPRMLHGQRVELLLAALHHLTGHVFADPNARQIICGSPGTITEPPMPPPPPVSCPATPSLNQGHSVNVAIGQENHDPDADLTVYNPVGPSVIWQRQYKSLRGNGDGYVQGDMTYQSNDFGSGWSQNYNVGVSDPSAGGIGSSSPKSIVMDDGSKLAFTASSVPTSASPVVHCLPVKAGFPYLMDWNYDGSAKGHYTVTFKDRTKWVTGAILSTINCYPLAQIVDRNGHAITFHYGAVPVHFDWPLLSSITNEAGTTLLTVVRATDGSGNVVYVSDCFGREVFYHDGTYANAQVPKPWARTLQLLDHVSQVVPTSTSTTPPDRYVYGYTNLSNGNLSATTPNAYELVPFLTSCSTPSPTGTGMSTIRWTYDQVTDFITSESDGNGNITTYTYSANWTRLIYQNSHGSTQYTRTIGYDNNMNPTTDTNGAQTQTETPTYSDPNDPYAPSSITDANNHTVYYTWDQYGNKTSETSARGTKTIYAYRYNYFSLGEVTQAQEGVNLSTPKTSTTLGYYEPSGLPQSITAPQPGTTGTGATVVASFTYDNYGNVLTAVTPGNNAASTIKTTFNYTSDGGYSQATAIGEPLSMADNLGETTHLRYDAQGQTTAITDALGHETDFSYIESGGTLSLGNQIQSTTLPGTGQTGGGRGGTSTTYLYPGGPALVRTVSDESGQAVRQVATTYGAEGEVLSVSGSTEPVSYTYDALYRLSTLKDGGSHTTTYFYNAAGYLAQVVYPGAGTPSAPLAPGTTDTVTFGSYDALGNLRSRTDGRNQTTAYSYSDPENLLTDIAYPNGTIGSVHFSFDSFGRCSTMNDGTGSQLYAYDDEDSLVSKQVTWTGLTAKTVSYNFYPDGNRQSMMADGHSFSYLYDSVGRLTGLQNDNNEVTTYSYQANGWLQTKSLANGIVTNTTLDALGRLTDLASKLSGTTLSDFAVPTTGGYDSVGNRLRITATLPGAPAAYGGTTSYAYDYGQTANPSLNRSQLTSETSTRGSGAFSYGYDGGTSTGPGNPTSFKGQSQTFNADNQQTGTGFGYDGMGNPTAYKSITLTFDPENRMTSYGSSQTDGYDGDGLRAWKQIGTSRTYYLYDGDQPILEYSGAGSVLASNTFGANGLVSRHTGTSSTFYIFDERGNVSQRTGSAAAVTGTDLYDAYGARTGTAAQADPFGYEAQAGYYTDTETGLILCTHRYYDPQVGRFVTRDPISYDGSINLYGYTNNNPSNRMDPNGTQIPPDVAISEGQAAAALAAALAAAALAALNQWMHDHPLPPIHLPPIVWGPPTSAPPPIVATPPRPSPPMQIGGDKSLKEWDKHQQDLADLLAKEQELKRELQNAKGPKAQDPIKKELDDVINGKNGIKGHRKEIKQKWPNGCPSE